jgi:aryl sulfotransferase
MGGERGRPLKPAVPAAPPWRAAAPDPDLDVLEDLAAFFRRGESGEGRALLSESEWGHYRDRMAAMAPDELLAWLERDRED